MQEADSIKILRYRWKAQPSGKVSNIPTQISLRYWQRRNLNFCTKLKISHSLGHISSICGRGESIDSVQLNFSIKAVRQEQITLRIPHNRHHGPSCQRCRPSTMETCGGGMQETVRTYDAKVVCKLYREEGFANTLGYRVLRRCPRQYSGSPAESVRSCERYGQPSTKTTSKDTALPFWFWRYPYL